MAQNILTRWRFACLILLSVVGSEPASEDCEESEWPIGDVKRCEDLMQVGKLGVKDNFGVIPGSGWDNLENTLAGKVVTHTYRDCKTTDDGMMIVPDNVYTVPVKTSAKESVTEVFVDFKSVTSSESQSVNAMAGVANNMASISGSFSQENRKLKDEQKSKDSAIVRSQIRIIRYNIWLQPDTKFSPEFQSHLDLIAANVELGYTEMAEYEAERLISEFGTHVITMIVAGAAIIKTDFVRRDYIITKQSSSDSWKVGAAAGATLKSSLSLSATYDFSTIKAEDDVAQYHSNLFLSTRVSIGGNLSLPNKDTTLEDLKEWLKGIDNNLVALDRIGEPIDALITTKSLPKVPAHITSKVSELVRKAIVKYYEKNAVFGCTDKKAPNFNPTANIDDGSCNETILGLYLGGYFTTCKEMQAIISDELMDSEGCTHVHSIEFCALYRRIQMENNPCWVLNTSNPATNSQTCPEHSTQILLRRERRNIGYKFADCHGLFKPSRNESEAFKLAFEKCFRLLGYDPKNIEKLFPCLSDEGICDPPELKCGCIFKDLATEIEYSIYWCSSSSPTQLYFGGLFTRTSTNHITDKHTCPYSFKPYRFMEDTTICITMDADLGKILAVPFGGFRSCEKENEFASKGNNSNGCPNGFIPHDFKVKDCMFSVCVINGSHPALLPLKKPPFMDKPEDYGASDYMWALSGSGSDVTPTVIAILSCGILVCSVLLFVIFITIVDRIRRHHKWKKKRTTMAKKDHESDSDSV